jgi:hypothetical protein
MSKLMSGLIVVAAASGSIATTLIWTLLTDPITIAAAVGQGPFRLLVTLVAGR